MECENCLRTSEEGYEIICCSNGEILCRDCYDLANEYSSWQRGHDEALEEMSVWDPNEVPFDEFDV